MKRFLFLCAMIGALGCGGSTEPTTVAGTYTLQTINGARPPVVIYASGGTTISVTSGTITIRSDGTFSLSRVEHFVPCPGCGSDSPSVEDGTYTQSGNDLTLTYSSCCNVYMYPTSWSGNTLTLTDPARSSGDITSTYVFTR